MYNAQFDLLNKSMQEDKDDAVKKAEPIIPTKIKGRLYEHQVKAYNYALKLFGIGGQRLSEKKSKAVAYLMDMGTGKTITTIVLVGAMNETNAVNKLLVVCPKSIVGVWEDEFKKFADYRYALTVLDGSLAKKKEAFNYMNGKALQVIVVISNYYIEGENNGSNYYKYCIKHRQWYGAFFIATLF